MSGISVHGTATYVQNKQNFDTAVFEITDEKAYDSMTNHGVWPTSTTDFDVTRISF